MSEHVDDSDGPLKFTELALETFHRVRLYPYSRRLVRAINEDDTECIRRVIQKHPMLLDMEITDEGHTALTLAASIGYPNTVKQLLALRASVNSRNGVDGMSALHHAVKSKPTNRDHVIEIVQELLNNYATVDSTAYVENLSTNGSKYTSEETPLMYAIHNENLAIIEVLIRYGADVNYKDSLCAYTPLLRAAGTGNLAIINLLLDKGADIHARSIERNNVLHWLAYSQGDSVRRCLLVLVEHGANINEVNDKGRTALMIAAKTRKPRMCDALISMGASLSCKDYEGLTAQDYAKCTKCAQLIRIAFQKRLGQQSKNNDGDDDDDDDDDDDRRVHNQLKSHKKSSTVTTSNNHSELLKTNNENTFQCE